MTTGSPSERNLPLPPDQNICPVHGPVTGQPGCPYCGARPSNERLDRLIGGLQELAGKLTDSGLYEYGISSASVYATIVREAIEELTPRTVRAPAGLMELDALHRATAQSLPALSGERSPHALHDVRSRASKVSELTAQINALQEPLRQYVHDLETDADPAGEKMRLLQLEENVAGLTAEIERLRRERDDYCRQLTRGIPVVRDLTMERDRLRAALQEIEWYPARATFTSDPKTWMDMRDLASRALRPGDFPERRSDETEKNDG